MNIQDILRQIADQMDQSANPAELDQAIDQLMRVATTVAMSRGQTFIKNAAMGLVDEAFQRLMRG